MPISAALVVPERALAALAAAIADAKGTDPLAPVTVAVPTNTCGVMTRRALGRQGGIAGVDMVTLNRLAELIAGPALAAAGRSPMSTPVIDLTIAGALADDPGPFGAVATHPSTVVALRELHTELRLADPDAVSRLHDESLRGRQAVRLSSAISAALEAQWYDEADLYATATRSVEAAIPDGLRNLVLHLPQELPGRAITFVRALGRQLDVRIVSQITGDAAADADAHDLVDALGATATTDEGPGGGERTRPPAIVTTTDADEEVREATRLVVAAAREGTPFERIAVLWPAQRPYARLVEHHLTAADIPWNGRPGTTLAERLAPRMVLDLLDVDRRGLRRRSLFDMLADLPLRGADGEYLPTASWERVSREAGVARDDDWDRRLGSLAATERWGTSAESLRAFVGELRDQLGHPAATRTWAAWATWCNEQLDLRLGRHTIERLAEPEYRAYEALTGALDRLSHLDPVSAPVTRHRFRTTLEAELDAVPPRQGRVGQGVTAAPLAGAVGLDVDVAIVLGAAEGMLPPRPTSDPLLSDADRALAGLPTSDARSVRLHRVLLSTLATSTVTLTAPRGDLRSTSSVELSRWIVPWAGEHRTVASHHAGITSVVFPASALEHRLRGQLIHAADGRVGDDDADTTEAVDTVVQRGIRLIEARRSDALTGYDGDLSTIMIPPLDHVVSPSRLESWSACPHAYFDQYLLDVEPVEEPGDEISITARDRGTAHHAALDLFHQAVVDGALAQPGAEGWTGDHQQALAAFFDQVCERTERRGRTGRPAFWADERERMLDDLLTWLHHDSELVVRRGSTVLASEMRFGADDAASIELPNGRQIHLKGSIDRVDRTSDGRLVVTDHKSGGKDKFKDMTVDDPTAGGTLFQLPSYAAAARARFGEPDTPVHAEYGLLRKGEYARPGFFMSPEVDARVSESLALVVAGIETGFFPNRPERPGWRFYVSCHYCEPDGLGTAERWSEWDRKHHDPRLAAWFGRDEAAT
ncbi:MAG TPA: PD-(D/E)XK nuclease family protein [Ilumatobacteraceae bacterium]|nr:PD-(D/E)XK nuclease family protein [Ilumatobacteraceae bacterium]